MEGFGIVKSVRPFYNAAMQLHPPKPPHRRARHPEIEALRPVLEAFSDRLFDDRYFRAFDWFKPYLPTPTQTILSVGCTLGREATALLWQLNAESCVGVDVEETTMHDARQVIVSLMRFCRRFEDEILPTLRPTNYQAAVWAWYQERLPDSIKRGPFPHFLTADITNPLPFADSTFDLIYGRYVLDKVWDTDMGRLPNALRELKRVLKPNGRLIAVEPTKRGEIIYAWGAYFREAGFGEVYRCPTDQLGFLEWPATLPLGFVLE